MISTCRAGGALALAAFLTACGDAAVAPTAERGIVQRDSAGIRIVENGPLDLTADLLVGPGPSLRIGVVDGPPEDQLFGVSDIKRLAGGGFAVLNRGTRELRIYEADGRHRVSAGGPGQGPAEFRYPFRVLVLPGDTLLVQDHSRVLDYHDRVFFGADGAFIRRETADRAALTEIWNAVGTWPLGSEWLPEGGMLSPFLPSDPPVRQAGPPLRPEVRLLRISADFASVDTIGIVPGLLQQYVQVGGVRGVMLLLPPFELYSMWATGPADGAIVVADNALPELHLFRADGARILARWTAEPERITAAEIQAWKEERRGQLSDPSRLPELNRGLAGVDVLHDKPFFERLFVGSDGTVWVETLDDGTGHTRLMAFDDSGRFRGVVAVPGPFWLFDSGPGWMVGVFRDENGVEFLHVYELRSG